MAALEEDFLETLMKKPWLWWRYIDDIFMIWQHGQDELKTFLEKLNNFILLLNLPVNILVRKLIIWMYKLLLGKVN